MNFLSKLAAAFICVTVCAGMAVGPVSSAGLPWTQWQYSADGQRSAADVLHDTSSWQQIKPGTPFKCNGQGAWLRADVVIPAEIDGQTTAGQPVGMRINSEVGGAIYVDGNLQARYDNDHAGMALLTTSAKPGEHQLVAVKAYRDIGGENKLQKLTEADLVILDAKRVNGLASYTYNAKDQNGPLPRPFAGISQGGGMADYNDDTAAMFRAIGIKWFRMDNIFTNAVKRDASGKLVYDWTDFDKRLDFMKKIGCQFIACASYMPEALEAFPNADRHACPKSYAEWEELCYQAAKHAIARGERIKYWEVWNETNAGWLVPLPGEDGLDAYLKLYDATWKGVRRADPTAWIGGPCNASGPWNKSPKRSYAVNGEKFMRGLLEHCEKTGAPLDFISWHEYFQSPEIFREEAATTRRYMKDYPKAAKGVHEFLITEWNYAWWPDWPQDHELGASWVADSVLRAMIPAHIAKPCFFYAKDGDDNFRGSWGMLMGPNRPKAVYNVAKLFYTMAPIQIGHLSISDPEVALEASTDPATGRTTVLILNYAERYGVTRHVRIVVKNLAPALRGGTVKRWVVDKDHSNAFNNKDKAELESIYTGRLPNASTFQADLTVPTNSVTLLELSPAKND